MGSQEGARGLDGKDGITPEEAYSLAQERIIARKEVITSVRPRKAPTAADRSNFNGAEDALAWTREQLEIVETLPGETAKAYAEALRAEIDSLEAHAAAKETSRATGGDQVESTRKERTKERYAVHASAVARERFIAEGMKRSFETRFGTDPDEEQPQGLIARALLKFKMSRNPDMATELEKYTQQKALVERMARTPAYLPTERE